MLQEVGQYGLKGKSMVQNNGAIRELFAKECIKENPAKGVKLTRPQR